LLLLSFVLFKSNGAPLQVDGVAPDADFASFALQALYRIEFVLGQDLPSASMIPHVRMQFEEHFVRALMAAGKAEEALDHAQCAYRWGKEAGGSGDVFARPDTLKNRSRRP
jgi:hypothetical protein